MLISACSTTYFIGRDFNDSKVSSLKAGETDKSQVIQMFGDPYRRGQVNQQTVFIYSYEESEFPAHSGPEVRIEVRYKSLMILFDENNVVKYFAHNVPVSLSALDLAILHEEKLKQQENSDDVNSGNN